MIRRLSILILLFAFFADSYAQTPFPKELSIGASFGMGVSSVTFNPRIKQNQYLGSHFGITGRWITQKNLGLILEVNYSQQGWDEEFDDPQYHYSRRINYIDIPFLTHIYFGSKRVRFFINLGPKIGFVISDSMSENVLGLDTNPPPNSGEYQTLQREKPIEHKFAWGICGGPGIELRTGIGSFQLEGRYYYGLGDLFKSNRGEDFSKSSSQVIFGKITYMIPLFK